MRANIEDPDFLPNHEQSRTRRISDVEATLLAEIRKTLSDTHLGCVARGITSDFPKDEATTELETQFIALAHVYHEQRLALAIEQIKSAVNLGQDLMLVVDNILHEGKSAPSFGV